MEGFLSLADAAQSLDMSPEDLSTEIAEGRVVAIIKDDSSWISPGEVRRLSKSRASSGPASQPEAEHPPKNGEPEPDAPPPVPSEQVEQLAPESEKSVRPDRSDAGYPAEEVAELKERIHLLSQRNEELEQLNRRLKTGLQETEAALRRSKNARANLENDIISLTEQLKKAQSRGGALEREVQHLTHELERSEEQYANELRRHRSMDRESKPEAPEVSAGDVAALRQQMQEKDRIISQEYKERSTLRAQLDDINQKYYELKARYDKEKSEWSEILARELQTHGQLKSQLEELRPKSSSKGWNPFRRDK